MKLSAFEKSLAMVKIHTVSAVLPNMSTEEFASYAVSISVNSVLW